MKQRSYALITPARNEEKYIEQTISSVARQTILPEKWIIVDDGSTDGTAEIVKRNVATYSYLELVCSTGRKQRDFASKAYAVREGYARLKNIPYSFIGNLDADTTHPEKYYEYIMSRFEENPKLGIAGGVVCDLIGQNFHAQQLSFNSVAGPIQLFRRRCWEEIDGYRPMRYGGVDAAAEILARMKGWHVQTFPEINAFQHRRVGTAQRGYLAASFKRGRMFCTLGYHPLFQLVRNLSRLGERPFIMSSVLEQAGYWWTKIQGMEKQLPAEAVAFLRKEQMQRLKSLFSKKYSLFKNPFNPLSL